MRSLSLLSSQRGSPSPKFMSTTAQSRLKIISFGPIRMCHFLLSGYLKSSDESQKRMANRLLTRNYLVWHRDEFCEKDKLFLSCAPTECHALRKRREIFLSNVFMALFLARGKDGTLFLVNLWAERSVSLLEESFLRNFQAKLVMLKSASYGGKMESTSRSSGFQ